MKNIEERRNRTIAREANYHASLRAPHIDKTAISPYDDYCDGYGMPGAYGNGYVSVLKVSAGTVEKTNDALIDTIVTYDKAETADAYIGQINMLTASSFCGMAGQVWGYDLARHDDITSGKSQPLFTEKQFDGSELKVFDAAPLLNAGVELFGTENNRRYHPIPGAHTICANKGVTAYRPKENRPLKAGEIGNAITVGPYVTLARNAVPTTGFTSLNDLNLSDWLKEMDFESLTNLAK